MKLDILAICAHPDDAELGCSGTLLSASSYGKKIGIVDLTQGELGTNGTAQIRQQEAKEASNILGLAVRENLGLPDGFFEINQNSLLLVIQIIRLYRPEIVFTNAPSDRHPDHKRAAELVKRACFLSGLPKIKTFTNSQQQQNAFRPKKLYHFIQANYLQPDFVVDITPFWKKKLEAIRAYKSQFFTEEDDSKQKTFISTPEFMEFIEARAREFGQSIGTEFGEGFLKTSQIGVKNIFEIF
ncbi:MAG: bacillithiol biosynthesis deacetylase BshB1 [Cytophagales bacterium]|nr:bacillithiol biosynthesis deacetylase BshB1 [Cytophagales bacterium]